MTVLDTFSLSGKVAVVTGGAGMYGQQIVEAIAEAGACTVTASRNVDALKKVADRLNARGHNVHADKLDLSEEDSIKQFCRRTVERHGQIDVLVNNAVLRPYKAGQYDLQGWKKSMQVNATGLYIICETVCEHMKQRHSGSIVNIASIQGMVGVDTTLYEDLPISGLAPDYFFHKGGMINYTRYLAGVVGQYNIRVNAISPGGFFANQPEEFVKRYNAKTLLGRMANETDLKAAVVFFASDASLYVTGANLPVDGGYTAK